MHRVQERTWGAETSQYPEEQKANAIPSVAASESGTAQTGLRPGVVDADMANQVVCESCRKAEPKKVKVLYQSRRQSWVFQSSTMLVKLRVNKGGPPSKAKYSSTTDSEPVR